MDFYRERYKLGFWPCWWIMIQNLFMRIFWGLVFIVVDIKLNDFDLLLPDFVGYFLIYTALAKLQEIHPRFRIAKLYAASMVFVSTSELLHIDLLSIVSASGIVLDFLMIWHTCAGIIELALQRGNLSLVRAATNRRALYFVLATTGLFARIVAFVAPDLTGALIIPLVVFGLTVVLLIMFLMRKASIEIS
jgi:hypothetical protein